MSGESAECGVHSVYGEIICCIHDIQDAKEEINIDWIFSFIGLIINEWYSH